MSTKLPREAEDAAKRREDEALDEALKQTFPASDPPAATAPGYRTVRTRDKAAKSAPRR
ncbi:MAG TPA: hypothetical protein VN715_14045 [Roseiarcus sp.]|nr:hypothetical protein [Roseiarcus sp.]